MLINASPLGKAVLNGSSGGNVQSLAAALSVGSSVAVVPLDVGKGLGASAVIAQTTTSNLVDSIPLASSVQVAAAIAKSDTSVAYVFEALNNKVASSISGDIPLLIALTAGRSDAVLNSSSLGGLALGSGSSFESSRMSATGTAFIVFAASGQISCQSYAIGSLVDTIPLADLASTGAVSNIINGDLGLTVNLGGAANVSSGSTANVAILHEIASSISVASIDSGSASVTKGLGGSVSIAGNSIPANTSVHYVIDSVATVAASVAADVNLVKPIGGVSSSSVTTSGKTSVHYVISASVLTLVSTNADLHKTDNLQDMEGTGAVSNIAYANIMLRKPLGGAGLSLAAVDGQLVSAHTVDADIASGATADAELVEIQLDLSVGEIFAEVTDITLITSEYEIWPSQQVA